MPTAPKGIAERVNLTQTAWETLRPDKKFGGMTLAQFKVKVKPSIDVRTEIAVLESQMTSALNRRDDTDKATVETLQFVVNSVKGDPEEGQDSELYEAMGYVRKSERSSGLHRGKGAAKAAP